MLVDVLMEWLYLVKDLKYQKDLQDLATNNWQLTDPQVSAFRFKGKSYDPFCTHAVYKPLLVKELHKYAEEVITAYESLERYEKHYCRAALAACYEVTRTKLHQCLPIQFAEIISQHVVLDNSPIDSQTLKELRRVHSKGLNFIGERILLNDLGL